MSRTILQSYTRLNNVYTAHPMYDNPAGTEDHTSDYAVEPQLVSSLYRPVRMLVTTSWADWLY